MTEHETFEKWVLENFPGYRLDASNGAYMTTFINDMWIAWQARAALDQGGKTGGAP